MTVMGYFSISSSYFLCLFSISSSYCFLIGSILSLNKFHTFHNSENSASPTSTFLAQFDLCKNSGFLHLSHSLSQSPFFDKASNIFFKSFSLQKSTLIFTIFTTLYICTAAGGVGDPGIF